MGQVGSGQESPQSVLCQVELVGPNGGRVGNLHTPTYDALEDDNKSFYQ